MALKKKTRELTKVEEKNKYEIHHDLMTGEEPRQTEISSRKIARKTKPNSSNRTQKQNFEVHKSVHTGEKICVCDQ